MSSDLVRGFVTMAEHFEGFVMNDVIAWMPLPEPYQGLTDILIISFMAMILARR